MSSSSSSDFYIRYGPEGHNARCKDELGRVCDWGWRDIHQGCTPGDSAKGDASSTLSVSWPFGGGTVGHRDPPSRIRRRAHAVAVAVAVAVAGNLGHPSPGMVVFRPGFAGLGLQGLPKNKRLGLTTYSVWRARATSVLGAFFSLSLKRFGPSWFPCRGTS